MKLGFVIETLPDGSRVKAREDGRRGHALGDEALLWDALREALDAVRERDSLLDRGRREYEELSKLNVERAEELEKLEARLEQSRHKGRR